MIKNLDDQTGLFVFMAVNNETGVKTPLEEVAKLATQYHIPLVVDAVALLGKEPFKIYDGISAMSFSGHKLHAPKGIGLTYLSKDYEIFPLIQGGAQEQGQRAGTHNLSGILGFAKAIELLKKHLPSKSLEMQSLRDYFEKELQRKLVGVEVNGSSSRICNTSNLSFQGVDGESLLINLDLAGLACSHGSACSSGSLQPSRVLMEMGLSKERLNSSLRFSLSRYTTLEEVNRAIDIIVEQVNFLRG